jgi:hypothetical protein
MAVLLAMGVAIFRIPGQHVVGFVRIVTEQVRMAGTLHYRLKVDHVYQRRFSSLSDSSALATALRSSHWYIITRRPSVRIVGDSVQVHDNMLTADFVTRGNPAAPERVYTFGSDFYGAGELRDFQVYADGAYFSVDVGGELFHGDAWALASFLSTAEPGIARQEVLYIGKAFGEDGSQDAWKRTQKHKKLQRIYEDHVNDAYEVFVAPLSLERGYMSGDDHIDDAEDGPSLTAYHSTFGTLEGRLLGASVNVVEHALIAYFVPPYNENLTEWRADQPTKDMDAMKAAGFRLIHVHLSGWWGLSRFHSTQEPQGPRGHFISHDIPPNPVRSARRGISAPKISDWRIGARLAKDGQEIFEGWKDASAVVLRVFGDEAPVERKPPGIILRRGIPADPGPEQRADAHSSLRAVLAQAREARRRMTEPIHYNGESTYDPAAGTIVLGEYLGDRAPVRIRLHRPASNRVASALVLGDPGSGKSNCLRVMAAEACLSGKFAVVPLILGQREDDSLSEFWSVIAVGERLFATSLGRANELLTNVLDIVSERLERARESGERPEPGILVAVDDADALLQDEHGARLVTEILERGASAGVGLLVVVSDIDSLTANADLMRGLVSCENKQAFMPDGYYVMSALTALYGECRTETWQDGDGTFVLHREGSRTSLGFLAGAIAPTASPEQVRALCTEKLLAAGVEAPEWDNPRDDPECWTVLDPLNVRSFELRRHPDGWALVAVISKIFGTAISEPTALISWAEGVIRLRFTVQQTPWRRGPSTSCPDSLTLYSDIQGELAVNDVDTEMMDILRRM